MKIAKLKDTNWKHVSLDEISLKFINGGTPLTSNPNFWNGKIPWIRSAWITKKYVDSGERFITDQGLKNSSSNIIPKNNVIIATRVSLGNVVINKVDVAINQDLTGIILDKTKVNEEFVYFSLVNDPAKITSLSQGSTIQGITRKQLENIVISLPPLQIQNKIISILSNIDDLIQKYDFAIESTKKLKTGLMQRLLTKGIGHKKFKKVKWYFGKEIEIPEEWKYVNVEYVADKLLSGGTPSTIIPEYWEGNIPWTKGALLTTNNTTKGERFISELGLKNSSTSIIPKNNLLVVSRVSIGNVSINKIDIAINQDITAVILNKTKCITEFLYWNLLQTISILVSFSQGTTIQGFTRKDLSSHKILLPPLPEQQKITSILDSVDSKIFDLESKKSQLEKLKKGLMQELLTGRIRVKI